MNLGRLLNPRSIAVIGGQPAARAIEQSDRLGFEGDIWPVHPTRNEVGGRPAFRSLDELPGVPDAAFVAINRKLTVEAVHQLAAMGVGGAVLYASGFAEAGPDGVSLQQELIEGHDMALIGPNCYGTINALNGAAMWPDVHGCRRVDRGPALIGQSGNITLNMTLNQRGVDFAYALSLGNQASVAIEDCVLHLAADPRVTAIGIYLESITDSAAFGRAATAALESGTPIVVLKTGRSATAGIISASHTAAMSSSSDAYSALFEHYGIIEVDTLPALMTALSFVDTIGPLNGNRLISLSCSGGEAALVADRAFEHDVVFEPLTEKHASRIKATLSDLVAMTNPLDYHTFIWGDEEALTECFSEALGGPMDAAMLVLDWPDDDNDDSDWWPTVRALESASAATGMPALVVASLSESLPGRVRDHLFRHGLGVAYSIDQALLGLGAMAKLGTRSGALPAAHFEAGLVTGDEEAMDEHQAKILLADHGVRIAPGHVVTASMLLPDCAYPVAAKVLGVSHKTEVGGVALGIENAGQLQTALDGLFTIGDRVLVEEMIAPGVAELLVSVRREAPVGIVIMLGTGGTLAEVVDDTATLLAPPATGAVEDALEGLKVGQLLSGFRGAAPGDIDSVIDTVDALVAILETRPDIAEIEINPLIVTPDRAVAADSLISWTAV